jgi:hypothetical protein
MKKGIICNSDECKDKKKLNESTGIILSAVKHFGAVGFCFFSFCLWEFVSKWISLHLLILNTFRVLLKDLKFFRQSNHYLLSTDIKTINTSEQTPS